MEIRYAYTRYFKKTRRCGNITIVTIIMLRFVDMCVVCTILFIQCIIRKRAHSLFVFRSCWWFVCQTPIDPRRTSVPSFLPWKKKVIRWFITLYTHVKYTCYEHKTVLTQNGVKKDHYMLHVFGNWPDLKVLIVCPIWYYYQNVMIWWQWSVFGLHTSVRMSTDA